MLAWSTVLLLVWELVQVAQSMKHPQFLRTSPKMMLDTPCMLSYVGLLSIRAQSTVTGSILASAACTVDFTELHGVHFSCVIAAVKANAVLQRGSRTVVDCLQKSTALHTCHFESTIRQSTGNSSSKPAYSNTVIVCANWRTCVYLRVNVSECMYVYVIYMCV
jgi:hypothetical protein